MTNLDDDDDDDDDDDVSAVDGEEGASDGLDVGCAVLPSRSAVRVLVVGDEGDDDDDGGDNNDDGLDVRVATVGAINVGGVGNTVGLSEGATVVAIVVVRGAAVVGRAVGASVEGDGVVGGVVGCVVGCIVGGVVGFDDGGVVGN
jgi:hypothetical protein